MQNVETYKSKTLNEKETEIKKDKKSTESETDKDNKNLYAEPIKTTESKQDSIKHEFSKANIIEKDKSIDKRKNEMNIIKDKEKDESIEDKSDFSMNDDNNEKVNTENISGSLISESTKKHDNTQLETVCELIDQMNLRRENFEQQQADSQEKRNINERSPSIAVASSEPNQNLTLSQKVISRRSRVIISNNQSVTGLVSQIFKELTEFNKNYLIDGKISARSFEFLVDSRYKDHIKTLRELKNFMKGKVIIEATTFNEGEDKFIVYGSCVAKSSTKIKNSFELSKDGGATIVNMLVNLI